MKVLYLSVNYSMFLACLTLPFSFRVSTFFLIAFAFLSLTYSLSLGGLKQNRKYFSFIKLPSIIFFIPLFGVFFTNYPKETFDLLIKYLPYFILSIAYFYADPKIKKGISNFIRLGIIYGVLAVTIYLFTNLFFVFFKTNESSSEILFSYKYTYRNFTAPLDTHTTYLGLLIIMSNHFVLYSKYKSIFKFLLLIFNLLSLLFIASKIILFIYVLQIIFLIFVIPSRLTKLVIVALLSVFSVVLVWQYQNNLDNIYFLQRITREIVWDINPNNKGTSVNGKVKDDSRLVRWKAIIETSKGNLLLGYGSGSESTVLKEIHEKNNLVESLRRNYNSHNQYLFYLLENGILGLIIFLYFLWTNLIKAILRRDLGISLFVCSLIVICFVENYLNRTMGVLAISIFLTFLKDNYEKNNPDF